MIDAVSSGQKLAFVTDQLRQYSGQKRSLSGSTLILCPFHSEKTPSGRIFHSEQTKSPGYFKCYGCGTSATWNNLAPMIGLKPFVNLPPQDEYTVAKILPDEDRLLSGTESFVKEKMRSKPLPANKRWRDIPTNLLNDIGGSLAQFYSTQYGWSTKRIFLPVIINGELSGYIKARLKKHPDYPTYLNASGPWSKTHGLFPYDYSVELMAKLRSTTMIIVEGPRDALRLLSLGIPALCILGTQSWAENKCKLLELGGVQRVVIMMDGDDAGITATELIKPSLQKMFDVEIIKLWAYKASPYRKFKNEDLPSKAAKLAGVALWDPGSCPERLLLKIKDTYFRDS